MQANHAGARLQPQSRGTIYHNYIMLTKISDLYKLKEKYMPSVSLQTCDYIFVVGQTIEDVHSDPTAVLAGCVKWAVFTIELQGGMFHAFK